MQLTVFHITILPNPAAFCAVHCLSPQHGHCPLSVGRDTQPYVLSLQSSTRARHIEVTNPTEQMQSYGCLCSMQWCHARPAGCLLTLPTAAAPWAECSPEPQMPSAHVSHIPIVFSPLQVLQFPVRAMYCLDEANQYAPGPLSYKIPTYLKRGWGAQTFSSDPAL